MQRADEVGREDEAALEDGDDEQVAITRRRNLARHLLVTRRNQLRVEENADRPPPDTRHQRIPMIWFSRAASLSATWLASAGGDAMALRNPIERPGARPAAVGSTSHE